MARVTLILEDGFEEIEAITLIDVLRRADIEVKITGATKKENIGAHNILVMADNIIDDLDSSKLDMIIIPGGMAATRSLMENDKVLNIIRELYDAKKLVSAICAASLVLNNAGILNCSYTCFPGVQEEIDSGEYVKNQNVVVDQNVMTSKGPGTAMEFALAIVREMRGESVYSGLKGELLI